MKSIFERGQKMKKTISLIMSVISILTISGCGSKNLEIHNDNMVVEVGSVLSTDVEEYVKIEDDKVKEDISVDISGVNTNEVGEGLVKITYKGKEYDINVKVEDTKGPDIQQKSFKVKQDVEYDVKDIVDVSDPSGCSVAFEDGSNTFSSALEGEQTLTVVAEDAYGNKSTKKVTVEVYHSAADDAKKLLEMNQALENALDNFNMP